MSSFHDRSQSPTKMNNVFFRHEGKLYCLHQWDAATDFALSEVREEGTRILYEGSMSGLAGCLTNLVENGSPERARSDAAIRVGVHHVINKGWLHTHGMAEIDLPELEVRDVPNFLAEDAARLLQEVCRYMQRPGVVVRLGETMALSDHTRFRFVKAVPLPGEEDHYKDERWQLAEIELRCDECGLTQTELN